MTTTSNAWTPERIKAMRVQAGLTVEDMAKVLGISRTSYHKYELGTRKPRKDKIKQFESFRRGGNFNSGDLPTIRKKVLEMGLLTTDLGAILCHLSDSAQETILTAILDGRELNTT